MKAKVRRPSGSGKPISQVNQHSFPLPTLGPVLRAEAKTLHSGRGFFVIRGLQPDRYSREENIIVYTGISSYIGSVRGRQDSKTVDGVKQSSMMNHIKDLSRTSQVKNIGAPAYTTDHQVFHCDTGDIVSLYCLSPAARGGESKLASSWKVYNELAKTRPDLIHVLAEDWVIDGYVPSVNTMREIVTRKAHSHMMGAASVTSRDRSRFDLCCSTSQPATTRQNASLSNTLVAVSRAILTFQEALPFHLFQSRKPKHWTHSTLFPRSTV